jgi:hypothetical protein
VTGSFVNSTIPGDPISTTSTAGLGKQAKGPGTVVVDLRRVWIFFTSSYQSTGAGCARTALAARTVNNPNSHLADLLVISCLPRLESTRRLC